MHILSQVSTVRRAQMLAWCLDVSGQHVKHASAKCYVVLAMLKLSVAAASEGMPCLLKHWISG